MRWQLESAADFIPDDPSMSSGAGRFHRRLILMVHPTNLSA
jgi:hypothetical protein